MRQFTTTYGEFFKNTLLFTMFPNFKSFFSISLPRIYFLVFFLPAPRIGRTYFLDSIDRNKLSVSRNSNFFFPFFYLSISLFLFNFFLFSSMIPNSDIDLVNQALPQTTKFRVLFEMQLQSKGKLMKHRLRQNITIFFKKQRRANFEIQTGTQIRQQQLDTEIPYSKPRTFGNKFPQD